ncbi:MAG: efflux RND transporter periplasmic adaptor subunit [Candidatus Eisenbacteria bacterium]|nr:efflux RND transporter periplasmic adaptor subunit [Candidatus Eisenbacteria bacterium]
MKRILIIAAVIVVALVAVWGFTRGGDGAAASEYEFAEVERDDLEDIISATGTLSAVGTVEVGTQVSGTLSDIFVDFNDQVTKGQVLALIDTTFLAASVKDSRANLMRAEAQLALTETQFARTRDLYERDLVSEADYEDAAASLAAAQASVLSAEAALDRARTNLDYAVITSPISGTVIERSVEPGQTVAASLSAPVLFIIAEDLAEMEIHVLVDESDIGSVEVGQQVRFTVDAYYEKDFWGEVRQVRLQPQTVQNVVNYTVVVDAPNDEGLLLPGMTATADFLLQYREDVLLVPNAALRFTPTMEMYQELRESMGEKRQPAKSGGQEGRTASGGVDGKEAVGAGGAERSHGAHGDGSSHGAQGGRGGMNPMVRMFAAAGIDKERGAVLWYLDAEGNLSIAPIEKGASDGMRTEIVKGADVQDGMKVITSVVESEENEGGSRNPLSGRFGRKRD